MADLLAPVEERVSHIVFMGMGEPLANYDVTVAAARRLNDPHGLGIAQRRITISTVEQADETVDGKPVAFSSTSKTGILPGAKTTKGVFDGRSVQVTSTELGQQATTNTYQLPPEAIMDWGVFRKIMKEGLEPGNKYDVPFYAPGVASDRLTRVTVEIVVAGVTEAVPVEILLQPQK